MLCNNDTTIISCPIMKYRLCYVNKLMTRPLFMNKNNTDTCTMLCKHMTQYYFMYSNDTTFMLFPINQQYYVMYKMKQI